MRLVPASPITPNGWAVNDGLVFRRPHPPEQHWAGAIESPHSEGRKLFLAGATPPCGLCHTLADAGSSGEVGPALDEIKPDAGRVEKAVRQGVGVMPANTSLSDAQIKLLAEYAGRATGGSAK